MRETSDRAVKKRQAIVDAARAVFLRNGYEGASMDEVAGLAAVSKQTVYKHFADKQRLFLDMVTEDIGRAEQRSQAAFDALADTDDLATDLRSFAREHVVNVVQPHVIQMRRLIIGEADRFPDLARTWYASGPERGHAALATLFRRLARRGLLRVPDPALAAQHFNWLILSIPLNQALFHSAEQCPPAELRRYADEGVRVFLAAYGIQPPA